MRLVWMALLGGALCAGGRASAAGALSLVECRLEHPLRLSSTAARCGTFAVPEDPTRPDGARITLRVAVVRALDRRSTAPPLFLLAGGPGQAATDLYTGNAGAFARANRSHDIVLVDQRGTGGSSPLDCPYPDDWQEMTAALPALLDATRSCLTKFGPRVRFYTTSVAVGDLDAVRRALGYARIDLYGSSYGTRVAELYMRRHPTVTHAVILDGVTYPEQVIGPDTPADAERALGLIVARCRESTSCAAAFPTLAQELESLRRRFGPQRQALEFSDPSSGEPMTFEFNRSVLNAALRFLSYSATEASLLPALIHQGAQGHLEPLAGQTVMLARQIGGQLASGMQNSVICSEDEPRFAGLVNRPSLQETYQGGDQLQAFAAICRIWPRGPVDADLHDALISVVPTLLLSGEADPVTPPADAERAGAGLSHRRQLVLQGEGHGQLATGCVPLLMAQFLDSADPAALDAGCLERHRPAPFFLSLAGPAP